MKGQTIARVGRRVEMKCGKEEGRGRQKRQRISVGRFLSNGSRNERAARKDWAGGEGHTMGPDRALAGRYEVRMRAQLKGAPVKGRSKHAAGEHDGMSRSFGLPITGKTGVKRKATYQVSRPAEQGRHRRSRPAATSLREETLGYRRPDSTCGTSLGSLRVIVLFLLPRRRNLRPRTGLEAK